MDHAEIRYKLSAYLDGAVTPREKSLIEEHLETCAECGTAVRELRRTVDRLRELGEEEPPPWLTQRIMARIGEEAAQEKSIWRRFFLPLRWKLPVEAAALVFLSVTVYLVYRTVSPEVKIAVPPVAEMQREAAPQSPPAAGLRDRTEQPPAVPEKLSTEKKKEDVASARGRTASRPPQAPPAAAIPSESSREETAPSFAPPPAPAPIPENKGSSPRILRQHSDMAVPRDAEEERKEEKKAASPAMRSKAAAPAMPREVRLDLVVDDADAAFREIGKIAGLSGGSLVRREGREEGRVAIVRVMRGRLGEFLERIGNIGEIRKTTPFPAAENGVVEVLITVETVNRPER
jgi:anti-sigma factor RsiW